MNFSEKLKTFRKEHGETQDSFAKLAGFPRSTIAELETGRKKATLKTISKISTATNTKMSEWITDDIESTDDMNALELLLDYLIDTGRVKQNELTSDKDREYINRMIDQILKNKLNKK